MMLDKGIVTTIFKGVTGVTLIYFGLFNSYSPFLHIALGCGGGFLLIDFACDIFPSKI